jgi:hypothetical protein
VTVLGGVGCVGSGSGWDGWIARGALRSGEDDGGYKAGEGEESELHCYYLLLLPRREESVFDRRRMRIV